MNRSEVSAGLANILTELFKKTDGQEVARLTIDLDTGLFVSDDLWIGRLCHLLNAVEGAAWVNITDVFLSLCNVEAHATSVPTQIWKLFEILVPDCTVLKTCNIISDVAPFLVRLARDIFSVPVSQAWKKSDEEGFFKKYLGVDFECPDWLLDVVAFIISVAVVMFGTTVTYLNTALAGVISSFGLVCRDFNNIRTLFGSSMSTFSGFASDVIKALFGRSYVSDKDVAYNQLIERMKEQQVKLREQANSLLQDPTDLALGEEAIRVAKESVAECEQLFVELAKIEKNTLNARPLLDNIKESFKTLTKVVADVRATVHAQCRQEPTVVWFVGQPGVGKSHILSKFRREMEKHANGGKPLPNVTINTADEYQTGLTNQIKFVTFDDHGQSAEEHDHQILFQLVTTEPFRTNQAALEIKGSLAAPEFVVAASNTEYIMQSTKIKNLVALNGRRQKVYRMENDVVKEMGDRVTADLFRNPDGTLTEFAKRKQMADRFFEIPAVCADLQKSKGIPDRPPRPVTFDEIVADAVHRHNIARMVWKEKVAHLLGEATFDGLTLERRLELIRSPSTETVSTEDSLPRTEGAAAPVQSPNAKAVLLHGTPGTGKSHLAREALFTDGVGTVYSLVEFLAKLEEDADFRGNILIDDITIGTAKHFNIIVRFVHGYYDGKYPGITRLVMTANPEFYKEFADEVTMQLFLRRCTIYFFSFKSSFLHGTFEPKHLEVENVNYDKIVSITCNGVEMKRCYVIEGVLRSGCDIGKKLCWIRPPTFTIDKPTYIVKVKVNLMEALKENRAGITNHLYFMSQMQVVRGTYRKVLAYIAEVQDILFACDITPSSFKDVDCVEGFMSQLNMKKFRLPTEETCIIHFNDVSLGVVSDETDTLVFGRHTTVNTELDDPETWDVATKMMHERLAARCQYKRLAECVDGMCRDVAVCQDESTNALCLNFTHKSVVKIGIIVVSKIANAIGKICGVMSVFESHRKLEQRLNFANDMEFIAESMLDYCTYHEDHPYETAAGEIIDSISGLGVDIWCRAVLAQDRVVPDDMKKVGMAVKENYNTSKKTKEDPLDRAIRRSENYNTSKKTSEDPLDRAIRRSENYNTSKKTKEDPLDKAIRRSENYNTSKKTKEDKLDRAVRRGEANEEVLVTSSLERMKKKFKLYQPTEDDSDSESESEKKSKRVAPSTILEWNESFAENKVPAYFKNLLERDLLQYSECVARLSGFDKDPRLGRHQIKFGKRPYDFDGNKFFYNSPSWMEDMYKTLAGYGFQVNSCVVNIYDGGQRVRNRRGKAQIPFHQDNEEMIDQTQPVVTMSVGERAELTLAHLKTRQQIHVPMFNNALFIMEPRMQVEYQHGIIAYNQSITNPRISFTFRQLKEPEAELASIPDVYEVGSPNQKVLDNQGLLVLRGEDGSADHVLSHVVFFNQDWGVMNRHSAQYESDRRKYIQYKNVEYEFNWTSAYKSESKDIAVFKITSKQKPPAKDITKYVGSKFDIESLQGLTAVIMIGVAEKSVSRMVRLQQHVVQNIGNSTGVGMYAWQTLEATGYIQDVSAKCRVTKYGDCGSAWMIDGRYHTRPLVAIHCAGSTNGTVYGMVLVYEDLLAAYENMCIPSSQASVVSNVRIVESDLIVEVDEAHQKSADSLSRVTEVVGQTSRPCPKPFKTKYSRSLFNVQDTVLEEIVGDDFSPVVFRNDDPRIPRDYEGDVMYDAQLKWVFGQPNKKVSREEIIECIEEIAEYAIDHMVSQHHTNGISKLTTTQAINGLGKERFPHSNPIMRKSSPGYPFVVMNHSDKMRFLERDEVNKIWKLNRDEGQKVADRMGMLTEVCRKNQKAGVVFMSCQKDEVCKSKKVYKTPKTRAFAAGPFDIGLLWRKYFLAAEQNCLNIAGKSFFTGGIDPMSSAWHEMITSMLEVGTQGFDEDTPNYDARMCNEFLEEQWRFYDAIYKRFDPKYTDDDRDVRRGIYKQLANPLITINDVVIKVGGHVSGKPATRTDNDVYNAVLKLMCWKEFCRRVKEGLPEFADLTPAQKKKIVPTWAAYDAVIRSKFGGDDHFCLIVDWLTKYWHFNSFKELMLDVWGVEITDAMKSEEGYTVRDLKDLEFLKRYSEKNGGFWRGKLMMSSFDKMLNWTQCNKQRLPWVAEFGDIIVPEDVRSEVDAVLREAVLHGPDFFSVIRSHLQDRLIAYDISIELKTWNAYNAELFSPLSREGFRIKQA